MSTWAEVAKGDRVELGGVEYLVEKIKPKGKRAKVTVTGKRGTFTNEVKLKDAVIFERPDPNLVAFVDRVLKGSKKRNPLHNDAGAQTRWAVTPDEADAVVGDVWDTPIDKVEKKLTSILGAHLIGETNDKASGWYVPPVDVSTVTAHWMTFHGGDTWHNTSSLDLLPLHEAEHAEADAGARILEVKHVHTKDRTGKVAS